MYHKDSGMSILSKLFGGGPNPANSAMPYLNNISQIGQSAYNPYISQGQGAGQILSGEYGRLVKDPTAMLDKIMGSYEPSKYYQFQKDMLSKALGSTAAAGGYAGNPYHQQQEGDMVQGLLSKDMQDYLGSALGLYKTGLGGESDIYGKGFDATGKLADMMGGAEGSKATLAFQGQQQENANRNALLSSILKMIGG
ncbi:MAG TPA: hypothetical protein VLB84_03640, partial [Bacteroidia bacterium]|nr:hypothetical protein [Bacteroidia bacterium]